MLTLVQTFVIGSILKLSYIQYNCTVMCQYSKTCLKQSPFGLEKNFPFRQVSLYNHEKDSILSWWIVK